MSDGALLAITRFNIFASPWDDDVDVTCPLDIAEKIYRVPDVPGKYKDISKSEPALKIFRKYCRGKAHYNICFKIGVVALEETIRAPGDPPDCISFEALNWGFLHIRYHEACEPFGQKMFDVFIHYKCLDSNSPHCERASIDYYDYLAQLTNVKPGQRFGGGFRPEWFDILVDVEHGFSLEKVVVAGVETYIPPKARAVKYWNGIYPGWDKKLLICPHDLFRAFNTCNDKQGQYRPEYSYAEANKIMDKIPDCKTALDKGMWLSIST